MKNRYKTQQLYLYRRLFVVVKRVLGLALLVLEILKRLHLIS